jgi:hypothetical protein
MSIWQQGSELAFKWNLAAFRDDTTAAISWQPARTYTLMP